jgi:hypothetical protein
MTRSSAPAGSSPWASIFTVRQKIMDYFYYAVVQGEGIATSYGDCAATCGQGLFKHQCCGEFTTINTGRMEYMNGNYTQKVLQPDSKDVFYVCINQSVAAADLSMNVMDVNVSVKCAEGTMSGAMRLVSASVLTLLAFVAI